MSVGGEGVAGVRFITDLGIVSKLDMEMLLPAQFVAHTMDLVKNSWET